jgi:excisionase family DNA binding protein
MLERSLSCNHLGRQELIVFNRGQTVMEALKTTPRLTYGLREVAELTGLSVAFLRNEVRAGRLRVLKFGRRVLVRDADLQEYLLRGSPGNKCEKGEKSSPDLHPATT